MSKWCLCIVEELVSHKDQLLRDPLTFKQNSSYELFWFFHYIFSFFFNCFSCLYSSWSSRHNYLNTLYSPMAWYSLVVLKVPFKIKQTNLSFVIYYIVVGGCHVCCLSVILCVYDRLSGTQLLRNGWTDLAEILHSGGYLSQTLSRTPGVTPREPKMYHVSTN